MNLFRRRAAIGERKRRKPWRQASDAQGQVFQGAAGNAVAFFYRKYKAIVRDDIGLRYPYRIPSLDLSESAVGDWSEN